MDFATKQLLIIDEGLSLSMTVGRAVAHFKLVCLMPHFFPSLFFDKFPNRCALESRDVFNSTTVRVKRPDSEGRRIESQRSEILNLIAENKPGQHSVDRPPSLLVANRYGPTIVRTNVQTLKGDFDQPEKFWGPLFMGPCWLSSNVQSAPSIPMLPSFHKWRALLN